MKFVEILPYLAEGSRFTLAEWPTDTFIGKSSDGYIAFTFKNNLQEARWTPSRYNVYDADWKTFRDVPLPTLKHSDGKAPTLFRLLDDTGVTEAHHSNITGSIDIAYFDERQKLVFQNLVDGNVGPCEPALELFLHSDWYIKATAEDVERSLSNVASQLEQPGQPLANQAPESALEPVVADQGSDEAVRHNAVSFAPEVSSEDEPGMQIRRGVYTAQGTMQQLLVEVHQTCDNIVYLTSYPSVMGERQEVISATLFEAMFQQLPRLTKGVTMRHRDRGAHVTVVDFDDTDVMVTIDLGYDTGNATISRERFASDEWDFVSYQPEAPEPINETNTAPGGVAEQPA